MSEHEYNDAMSRLWKAEAEIERLRNDYEIQMRKTDVAQLECERLREANTFAAEILSRWLAHQYSHQEQYRVLREARDKLRGANEQSASDQLKECDGCGRKMPDLRCPECRNA